MEQIFAKHLHPPESRWLVRAAPGRSPFALTVLEWTSDGDAARYATDDGVESWCLNPAEWRVIGSLQPKPATEVIALADVDAQKAEIAAGFDARIADFRRDQEQRQQRQSRAAQTTQGPLAFAEAPSPEPPRVKVEIAPFRLEFDPARATWTFSFPGAWNVAHTFSGVESGTETFRTKIEVVRQQQAGD